MRLLAAAIIALAALSGCTATADSATPAASPSQTKSMETVAECVEVNRAYAAWNSGLWNPQSADDIMAAPEMHLEWLAGDGTKFLDSVKGYDGKEIAGLRLAAARANAELGTFKLKLTLSGGKTRDAVVAANTISLRRDVTAAYEKYQASICA